MHFEKTVTTTVLLAGLAAFTWAQAADFSWRGQLADGGEPADGSYDLSVAVYADQAGEAVLGGTIEFDAVSVSNGEFAVTLPLDEAIDLDQVWLQVSVRDAGDPGGFETLAQRQRVELRPAAVCPAAWEISGNVGLGPGNFLGTTDATALELRADNRRAMRVEPVNDAGTFGDAPNLILGSSANAVVGAGIVGATISGGGSNQVGGSFASIGGGQRNDAAGTRATVAGGSFNQADGTSATVGGGSGNNASSLFSAVPGGWGNTAGGEASLAAGYLAHVRDASESGDSNGDEGTFVWSDRSSSTAFFSSGPNQFLIRATEGVALNATPVHPDVEMNIRPDADGPNFANLFLGQRGTDAGVLFSAGDATGSSNNAVLYMDQYDGSAQTRTLILGANGDLTVFAAAFKPGGGSWSSSSDARLKKNLTVLDGALDRLLALEGVSFEYTDPDPALRPEGRHMGFVAQQVQPLFPHWVGRDPEGYLTVGVQGFEALVVEALRELRGEKDREIAALQAHNEAEIAALRAESDTQIAAVRAENEALAEKLKATEAVTLELNAQLDSFKVQQERLAARLDAVLPEGTQEQRIAGAGSR